jgi:hypothetical protein
MIFSQSSDIQSFIDEMNNNNVIGKHIWYEPSGFNDISSLKYAIWAF